MIKITEKWILSIKNMLRYGLLINDPKNVVILYIYKFTNKAIEMTAIIYKL